MKTCLVGIPDDVGVKNVGGRVGAAQGPELFRKYWGKLKGEYDIQANVEDLGDIAISDDIQQNHTNTISFLESKLPNYDCSIIIGGGHDHGYTQLSGVNNAFKADNNLGCINIDPHFDLRKPIPVISSGSPYYLVLDQNIIKGSNFIEFGIQSHCNAKSLWNFAQKHQVDIVQFEHIRNKAVGIFKAKLDELSKRCDHIVISLDMDVFQASFAPGVSAPAAEGFNPSEVIEMMEIAGQYEQVKSLGIFELNPEFDIDDRTARLAAVCAYHFAQKKLGNI